MKRQVLEEMIWPEVAEALPNIKVGIIPVGSCEQHGPNMTFVVDSARAYGMSKLLAERCGNKVLVFPPVTYGISFHHKDFPGTVSLRVNTMTAMLVDIALGVVSHGIDKVLFVNGHGGNNLCLMSAIQILKQEHNVCAFWTNCGSSILGKGIEKYFSDLEPGFYGHACEVETSQTMYLCPEIVREKREKGMKQPGMFTEPGTFVSGSSQGVWNWKHDMTWNGCQGDARRATAEIGEQYSLEVLDYLEKLVDKIIAHNPTF